MSTFDYAPHEASLTTAPRVRTAALGDGYEQRVADGINNAPRRWQLTFVRPTAEAEAIEAFLVARNGVEAFDWTPPTGAAGRWVAREWTVGLIGPVARSVAVTFEEAFGA